MAQTLCGNRDEERTTKVQEKLKQFLHHEKQMKRKQLAVSNAMDDSTIVKMKN